MDKNFAIFDMDGTLVDSMKYWKNLAAEFLKMHGGWEITPEIREKIKPMTMEQSAALFIERFGIESTPDKIADEMNDMMASHYRLDVKLKEGIREYLKALSEKGVKMCVASATAKPLMEACLKRLGVLEYFEFLLSCEDIGVGKNSPDIYLKAAERFKTDTKETAVYEDAFYAVQTAKQAGFYVIGVYDENAARNWEKIKSVADETIKDWHRLKL